MDLNDTCAFVQQATYLVSDSSSTLPDSEIARLCEPFANSKDRNQIALALDQVARGCLDRASRQALALARVAYVLSAGQNNGIRAATALTCARALNALGEFQAALASACEAATLFSDRGDEENVAQSLCEAAWANTFIGDLRQALRDVEQVREKSTSARLLTQCDWIQARVLRSTSQYPQATKLLERSTVFFQSAQLILEAKRCERELAYTRIFSQHGDALAPLEQLRQWFEALEYSLDAAQCDLARSSGLIETGQYAPVMEPLIRARTKFTESKADFFVAVCDRNLGIVHHYLSRYDESLQASHRARDYFLAYGINVEVSACDINLGLTYYWLNRYDEALQMYQQAEDLVQGEGREARKARIWMNKGIIYGKLGSYSQALDLQHRALRIAESKELVSLVVGCHANLAMCYRELGDYDQALVHELKRKQSLIQRQRRRPLIPCNISLAEIYFARGEMGAAIDCLEQARSMAEADGLDGYIAACDRLLAQANAHTTDRKDSLARLGNARRIFLKQAQPLDAALCDLTQAELHLRWGEIPTSCKYFRQARKILSPTLADQAWRADYGLGRCALATNKRGRALDYHLRAVRAIAASRSALVTEQLSNDFFQRRQTVYDDALALAFNQQDRESSLQVIELSKARMFLTLLRDRAWKSRHVGEDQYVADLIEREKQLRLQMNSLRELAIKPPNGHEFRGRNDLALISPTARKELQTAARARESVATQLRLAITGLASVSEPEPFGLEQFRESVDAHLGDDWAALDYHLSDDDLTTVLVSPKGLKVSRKKLSEYDRSVLDKCVTTNPDVRALVYKGTLSGVDMPSPSREYLSHLYRLLIPEGLDAETLMIAPHRRLHALPFHALMNGDRYLIEQHTLIYTPSLQVLQILFSESIAYESTESLVLGMSNFGGRMPTLQSAKTEVEKILGVFGASAHALWEDQATRKKLFELNASGELQKAKLLHFASHAILNHVAPHQSRVFLHDDELTSLDIFDLTLNARLVTLSACQTALGKGGRGDEALSLARAFFYAGARGLLATLWHVEDAATLVKLIERFYRGWTAGNNAAQSLRNAAIEMIREGKPPYYWAPFVLIGRP